MFTQTSSCHNAACNKGDARHQHEESAWRSGLLCEFYIDTGAEKVEYIDWLIHKIRTTDLFECSYELDLSVATFPDLSCALYIQNEEEHHVFPVRSAAEKVLLAEMLANGEMNRFFDVPATEGHDCHVSFEKANAIVPMDVDGAVYTLSSVLPEDLAAKVVGAAIEEI